MSNPGIEKAVIMAKHDLAGLRRVLETKNKPHTTDYNHNTPRGEPCQGFQTWCFQDVIDYDNGWHIYGEHYKALPNITHCPFCGTKLEKQ